MRRRPRRRPEHRPGAGIFLLAVMSLLGAIVGLVAEAFLWTLQGRGRGPYAIQHFIDQADAPNAFAVLAMTFGAGIAFFFTGLIRGSFRYVGIAVGTLLALLLGAAIGALVAASTFFVLWSVYVAGAAFQDAFALAPFAVQEDPLAFAGFLVVGTAVGIGVTAFFVHTRAIEQIAAALSGLTLGATAGVVLYAFATLAIEGLFTQRAVELWLRLGEIVASGEPLEFVFAMYGGLAGLLVGRYRWRFYGLVTFVSLLAVVGGFLVYSVFITLPRVDPEFQLFAWTLFVAETVSLVMVLLYSFYSIDVTSRKSWLRGPSERFHSRYYMPKVAFHVPTYNEPAPLVLDTLRALERVEYPKDRMLIMVLDDSTDPECRGPLEAHCRERGIAYVRRPDRSGYKAGALNHGLALTPDDVDAIAVIDADYQVEPQYLRETVGYFIDPSLGWVQTPQDYRNPDQSFLARQYFLSDAYFYRTVMPSRNEENTIIFAGTMGIVRKDALLEVGRWDERYITEDAELSLRLLLNGYGSVYVNKTYGRGLIPPTFDGYKKQHYRWAFGGGKILRGHLHHLLFGRLTRRQAFDYFVGSVHWFEGLFILLIAALLLTLGWSQVLQIPLATHHSQEIFLIGLIPFFVLIDGVTRLHSVMSVNMRLTLPQTLQILGMWFSVKFSNAFAATKAFLGFGLPFVRTPKAPGGTIRRGEAFRRAIAVTRFESLWALILLATSAAVAAELALRPLTGVPFTVPASFLLVWLLYYCFVFGAAPLYAYMSYATFQPEFEARPALPAPPPGRPLVLRKPA